MRLRLVSLRGTRCFNYGLACNQANRGWRGLLAQWLRRVAQRLDGRWSLALDLASTEQIDVAAQREVIKAGLDHMVHQLGLVTKLAAVEQMMAEQRPGLMDTKR